MVGRVLWWRFVIVGGAAAVVSLGLAAGIILGAIPVGIASDEPISVAVSSGTAGGLALQTGVLSNVGGGSNPADHTYGAAVHLDSARLNGLCLLPRVGIPFTGITVGIRLSSGTPVRIDDVTLGAIKAQAGQIRLPATSVGLGGGRGDAWVPGDTSSLGRTLGLSGDQVQRLANAEMPVNGMQLSTAAQPTDLGPLRADVYNLRLTHGISLTSLSVDAGLNDENCP